MQQGMAGPREQNADQDGRRHDGGDDESGLKISENGSRPCPNRPQDKIGDGRCHFDPSRGCAAHVLDGRYLRVRIGRREGSKGQMRFQPRLAGEPAQSGQGLLCKP